VLAGSGGNGAGGLAAARLLHAAGAEVVVRTTGEPRLPGQLDVLAAAGVDVAPFDLGTTPGDVVIDAMLGSGAQPGIRGQVEAAVGWLRSHQTRVVALDLPSGMLADEGLRGPCVTADITVTLGAPKVGLRDRITHPYLGDLYLADLGIPAGIWRRAGVEPVTAFARGPLVRLVSPDRNTDAGTPDQGAVPAYRPTGLPADLDESD
jgi:NAD(P)H-hydrate epimerase